MIKDLEACNVRSSSPTFGAGEAMGRYFNGFCGRATGV